MRRWGYFGVDEKTLDYFRATGRPEDQVETIRNYFTAQGMFGIPRSGEVDYTKVIELDLGTVTPAVSGPRRPQDRIDLDAFKSKFSELLDKPIAEGGFSANSADIDTKYDVSFGNGNGLPIYGDNQPETGKTAIGHGDVLIAAITSCTNTSNPSVMLAAGIVAKKAFEKGLKVPTYVKTSLGPGSRVVTEYLERTGLQHFLDEIGFDLVGYGCTNVYRKFGTTRQRDRKGDCRP